MMGFCWHLRPISMDLIEVHSRSQWFKGLGKLLFHVCGTALYLTLAVLQFCAVLWGCHGPWVGDDGEVSDVVGPKVVGPSVFFSWYFVGWNSYWVDPFGFSSLTLTPQLGAFLVCGNNFEGTENAGKPHPKAWQTVPVPCRRLSHNPIYNAICRSNMLHLHCALWIFVFVFAIDEVLASYPTKRAATLWLSLRGLK